MEQRRQRQGRGEKTVCRQDNGQPVSSEDVYTMVMMHTYQRTPVHQIARKFSIKPVEVRDLIGRRACGGCCG